MLLTLMMNLGMFGDQTPAAEVGGHSIPPWIRTKEQIEHIRKKVEELRAKAPPEIVEELEEAVRGYEYVPGELGPLVDYEKIAEQAALVMEIQRIYDAYLAYMAMILEDDEAFLQALAESGEIL